MAYLELVPDVVDAPDFFGDVFGEPLGAPILDDPGEDHFLSLDADFDVRRIDIRVTGQTLVDLVADRVLGTAISARPAPDVARPIDARSGGSISH